MKRMRTEENAKDVKVEKDEKAEYIMKGREG